MRFVGVVDRPAGLHGLCSFLNLPFESALVANGELDRVEVGLDVSDWRLFFLEVMGSRDVGFGCGCGLEVEVVRGSRGSGG